MEESRTIWMMLFDNFSIRTIVDGWQLNMSWAFTFFIIALVLFWALIKIKIAKKDTNK